MRTIVAVTMVTAMTVAIATGRPLQDPPPGMARYSVVLLKAGPKWQSHSGDERTRLLKAHLAYFRERVIDGGLVAVGPASGGEVIGILISPGTVEQATALANGDPAVKAGELVPVVYGWLGTAGIGAGYVERAKAKPLEDLPFDSLQFAILTRGPNYSPDRTPEIEKLQAGHMEHIGAMARSGRLVSAGPFIDGGSLRGLFIFRCTPEEAREAASGDPMLKAGRLVIEFVTWTPNVDVIPAGKKE